MLPAVVTKGGEAADAVGAAETTDDNKSAPLLVGGWTREAFTGVFVFAITPS